MKTICTTSRNEQKNILICLDAAKDFNFAENIISAVIEHVEEITRTEEKYIFVNFSWTVNGVVLHSSNNWVFSEEAKIAKDFFTMQEKNIKTAGGAKYIINPFLRNSYYINVNNRYFYIDK